jgi:hypothetical protein
MRAVHLVGVDHVYQLGPHIDNPMFADSPSAPFEEFDAFLRLALVSHNIRGLAEEMSRAALRRQFRSGESLPWQLARAIDLPHRYCDPDPEMQKALNITSDSEREKYWIRELIIFDTFPVLFVLGASHVESFERLLSDSGFYPVIIVRDFKASQHKDVTNASLGS